MAVSAYRAAVVPRPSLTNRETVDRYLFPGEKVPHDHFDHLSLNRLEVQRSDSFFKSVVNLVNRGPSEGSSVLVSLGQRKKWLLAGLWLGTSCLTPSLRPPFECGRTSHLHHPQAGGHWYES